MPLPPASPDDDDDDMPPQDLALLPSPPPSPDFTPPSPLIERRARLATGTETALRAACVEILRAQDPTMQIYEDMKRSEQDSSRRVASTLKKYESQTAVAPKNGRRPAAEGRKARALNRPEHPPLAAIPGPPAATMIPFKHVPQNAASCFTRTTSRSASLSRARADSLDTLEGNAAVERPHTAQGPSRYDSSFSTTSNITWGQSDRESRSTGITTMPSWTHTPAGERLDSEEQARYDARARSWMTEELARRRAEQDRPPSRGTRLAEYLRPRGSRESLRSAYSTESAGGSSWWRGGSFLRRNNSTSSFRSNHRAIYDEAELPANEVDLNRALPPLPSLDTWQAATTSTSVKGHAVLQVTKLTSHTHPAERRRSSGPRTALPDAVEQTLSSRRMPATATVTATSMPSANGATTAAKAESGDLQGHAELRRQADNQRREMFDREVDESMRIGSIEFPLPLSAGVSRSNTKTKTEEERRKGTETATATPDTADRKREAWRQADASSSGLAGEDKKQGKKKRSLLRRSMDLLGFGSGGSKPAALKKAAPRHFEIVVEDRDGAKRVTAQQPLPPPPPPSHRPQQQQQQQQQAQKQKQSEKQPQKAQPQQSQVQSEKQSQQAQKQQQQQHAHPHPHQQHPATRAPPMMPVRSTIQT